MLAEAPTSSESGRGGRGSQQDRRGGGDSVTIVYRDNIPVRVERGGNEALAARKVRSLACRRAQRKFIEAVTYSPKTLRLGGGA